MATARIRKPRVDVSTPTPTARKPRARKPSADTSEQHARIEAALTRLVTPPTFVAGSTRTVDGIDYTVALYSDDSVRIARDSEPVASGRFVATVGPAEYPGALSIDARIVDVMGIVDEDLVRALANDLTYFAFRAGRFSGGKGA